MKYFPLLIIILAVVGCSSDQSEEVIDYNALPSDPNASFFDGELDTRAKRVSYAIAINMAERLHKEGVELNVDAFLRGIEDVRGGEEHLITRKAIRDILAAEQRGISAEGNASEEALVEANRAAGEAFFAENSKKPGVTALETGLQYKPIKEGVGAPPLPTDTVVVNYEARFIDGTVFDSSKQHDGGVSFPVNGVIRGWSDALQLMAPGSSWEIYIPSEMAYGLTGYGAIVPPHSTVILNLELLSIVDKDA